MDVQDQFPPIHGPWYEPSNQPWMYGRLLLLNILKIYKIFYFFTVIFYRYSALPDIEPWHLNVE